MPFVLYGRGTCHLVRLDVCENIIIMVFAKNLYNNNVDECTWPDHELFARMYTCYSNTSLALHYGNFCLPLVLIPLETYKESQPVKVMSQNLHIR